MRHGQAQVVLRPLQGGSFTEVALSATVPTSPSPAHLRGAIAGLAFWSGWPVELVLCVGNEAAGWCEVWSDALGTVGERHLELRFRLPPDGDEERRRGR